MQIINFDDYISQNLQENLAKVDPRYKIEIIELSELPEDFDDWEQARASRLPLAPWGWQEDIHDPHNWVQPYMVGYYARTQRFPGELADKFGALVDAGVSEANPDTRQAIYEELTQLDYDNAIAIRLSVPFGRRYEQRWVKGWYYNPIYSFFYFYALAK